ncbi:MAG: acyl-CoA/acyl-ACP dehydrogenase [Acidimicrobiales bacterium]|jgi:alkylation response protein AidB-like acyl-CoA dehydrogenase|nr:acyl-CoA/acyl-ACP dehydrogenase [Acidimicrobiales bacterium]
MDFDLTEEQDMLRDVVRGVCSSYAGLDVVRAMEDDPVGYPPELWKQLAELDLIGLLLPTEYGGSGMTALEGALVYQELGRALAPSPHFVSAVLSGGVLVAAGSEEQKQAWLPAIARGEAILTTAVLEPSGGFRPLGIETRATPTGDGWTLTGTKWHVPFASSADRLVVLARTGDGAEDLDVFLVAADASGVSMAQQKTLASDNQWAVTLDGVTVPAADRIGPEGSGWATWSTALSDGLILLAAQAVGGAQFALDITTQYAKDRKQFDKPLGAFQALSHYLADAKTAVDGAETLVFEAAWARSEGRDIARLAPMAKLFACQTYRDVTAMAQQIFGGVGFTVEYDIQLYFRRAKSLQIGWLDDQALEERIAAAILD